MTVPGPPLLKVCNLTKHYPTRRGLVRAVDGLSFEIRRGETLAIVGESGCGKSTMAMTLLGLTNATSGSLSIEGSVPQPISSAVRTQMHGNIAAVFQNPQSSLNPKMRVEALVAEPLKTALGLRSIELRNRTIELLADVGMGEQHLRAFPHKLSGGQLQRVAIARALALKPQLLVLDEPTSALDVSIQAQTLMLLKRLQSDFGLSYLFISHDLGAVDFIADRVIVMYLGKQVESGNVADVFSKPKHPYTQALIDAIPTINPEKRGHFALLTGEIPSPLNRPVGCSFSPRCRHRTDVCCSTEPGVTISGDDRSFACFNPIQDTFVKSSNHETI